MSEGHQPQGTMLELPRPSQTLIFPNERIDMALEQLLEGDANHTRRTTRRSSLTQASLDANAEGRTKHCYFLNTTFTSNGFPSTFTTLQ